MHGGTRTCPAVCSYTKMGYAGNEEPSYIIPTCIATKEDGGTVKARDGVEDLDFYVGDEAIANATTYGASLSAAPRGSACGRAACGGGAGRPYSVMLALCVCVCVSCAALCASRCAACVVVRRARGAGACGHVGS